VRSTLIRFLLRRVARAVLLVFAVSSAALLLVHLAPGDAFSPIDVNPAFARAERARLGLDRPFIEQYSDWLGRVAVLDLGESVRFDRPVATLLNERVSNTLMLGCAALVIAIGLGVPAGVLTGSAPRQWWARIVSALSLLLLSTPPLVTALVLLMIAARTGWLPTGGLAAAAGPGELETAGAVLRHVPLPALALALPIAAALERLQSRAMAEALREPSVTAARARGVSRRRSTWVHAFRLSLKPVVGVLGIVIGTVLSGSFIVEYVMSWPGLGGLMYDALVARDLYLAAGCAASGAVFLAVGLLAADVALAFVDPRTMDIA
jgi:ABC-type dipeptide/oligopeptide/nickel transport system permease component